MQNTKSQERCLAALTEAAEALIPSVDDRRHSTPANVIRAHTRRAGAISQVLDALVGAIPRDALRDPNMED